MWKLNDVTKYDFDCYFWCTLDGQPSIKRNKTHAPIIKKLVRLTKNIHEFKILDVTIYFVGGSQ